MSTSIGPHDAMCLQTCIEDGGVAVFPADTVYGLCCDPENMQAIKRLYELKGRPAERPAAVMFFNLQLALETLALQTRAIETLTPKTLALETLDGLSITEHAALEALLPGPITLLLPNRTGRFALACGPGADALNTLGLRVPRLPERLNALAGVQTPVMQSSANMSGQPDARTLAEVPKSMRDSADLVLDGGELRVHPQQ